MKNKKSLAPENAVKEKNAKNFSARKTAEKLTAIAASALLFASGAFGCSSAKSGKDGKNGLNGKDGKDGVATSITLDDGKVTLDGTSTLFDGETLSAVIDLSVNESAGGTVSGGGRYPLNTAVLISATPDYGYIFLHWKNEKGEIVSENRNFLTSATETEQNYTAFFEIDKSKAAINVNVRADKSLPDGAVASGGGHFAYGSEYSLTVTADDKSILNGGTVLFYEVTEEQFDDENFSLPEDAKACSRGQTARFDVNGLTDKYYLAAFIDRIDIDVSIDFNIIVEASCDIEIESSNDFYGTAAITEINGKTAERDSDGKLPPIWAGDSITVTAAPTTAAMFDDAGGGAQSRLTIDRSAFVGWIDEFTGETVSTERKYTFVAKSRICLKAIFEPKTVLHLEATGVTAEIIAKSKDFSNQLPFNFSGSVTSFFPGEDVFVYAYFGSAVSTAKAERLNKFIWQISYNNTDWETLTYSRQAYIKIPENTPTVYIRAVSDKKA